MRRLGIALFAMLLVFATVQTAEAQFVPAHRPRPQAGVTFLPPRKVPPTEIGVGLSLYALMEDSADFHARVTRNRNEWFATEYSFLYRPGKVFHRPASLLVANVRLGVPDPRRPVLGFVTLGVAAGDSLNFNVSPVVGVGFQAVPRRSYGEPSILMRLELQYFTRGKSLEDRGRLMFGFVVPIGGRW